MKKLYLAFLFIILLLYTGTAQAQLSSAAPSPAEETTIEGLSIYPNPASGQKIYVVTENNQAKVIEIYNVLGKNILSANLTGNELNISSLEPGVYIMKIQEGQNTATRKLVVR